MKALAVVHKVGEKCQSLPGSSLRMKILKIICAGFLSTSMMTFFSYKFSQLKNQNFREPELLSMLIKRLVGNKSTPGNTDGWALHYIVGFLFVIVYDQLWSKTRLKPGLLSGATLGGISGIFGAEVWKKIYQLHPNPPENNFRQYYNQLLIAHVIFGLFAEIGYKIPDKLNS